MRDAARAEGTATAATAPGGGPVLVGDVAGMRRAVTRFVAELWIALADDAEPVAGDGTPPEPRARSGVHSDVGEHDRERVRALVTLAQQGDAEAFGQLYAEHVGAVYRYVYLRTGNRHLAEDITSETFLRALRRIDSFSWQGRDIVAWFLTIARNLVVDAVKSAPFRLEVATAEFFDDGGTTDQTSPEDAAIRRLGNERLVEALRRLTGDQAECLVLRFLEGLSLAESAQILGRSENAVKQLQLRAVRALRKELSRDD